jgi:hypothetical protein
MSVLKKDQLNFAGYSGLCFSGSALEGKKSLGGGSGLQARFNNCNSNFKDLPVKF